MENFFNFLTTLLKSALGLFLIVVVAGVLWILWAEKQSKISDEKWRVTQEQQRVEFVRKVQSGDIDKSVLVCDSSKQEWNPERAKYDKSFEKQYLKFYTQDSFVVGTLKEVRESKKASYQYNTMIVSESNARVEYTDVNVKDNLIINRSIVHNIDQPAIVSVTVKENGYDMFMQTLYNCVRAY